jgi:hypothetical protein
MNNLGDDPNARSVNISTESTMSAESLLWQTAIPSWPEKQSLISCLYHMINTTLCTLMTSQILPSDPNFRHLLIFQYVRDAKEHAMAGRCLTRY